LIIHPLTLSLMWLEFAAGSDAPPFLQFMQTRLWLVLLPKHLHMGIVFAALGCCFGLGFAVITRLYMRNVKALQFMLDEVGRTIPEVIKAGESLHVEFKSSVRWDLQNNSINRGLETVIAKTIAGFCNTKGGSLVIGVADDGGIVGLEHDYQSLRDPGRDGFERMIIDIVKKKLGGDLGTLIHFSFLDMNGKDVCMLSIEPAPRAIYLDEGGASVFYVRSGNSTRKLDVRDALNYANTRWLNRG
jgi:hypothetical protein